jgi:hypothetical protein
MRLRRSVQFGLDRSSRVVPSCHRDVCETQERTHETPRIPPACFSRPPAWAGPVVGQYVEARTAEVFAGGCIMSSEAETIGRQAVMAWRIDAGTYRARRWTAFGSSPPCPAIATSASVRSAASRRRSCARSCTSTSAPPTPQREALAGLAGEAVARAHHRGRAGHPGGDQLRRHGRTRRVRAGQSQLTVKKSVEHGPACGAMKWFTPFSVVDSPRWDHAGARVHGRALDARWSAPNRKSAFFGAFHFEAGAEATH